MTTRQNDSLLNITRWALNILIVVVGFFIQSKLSAVDKGFDDLELRVRNLEDSKARSEQINVSIIEKLDLIITKQNKWEEDIANFYYLNPKLSKPNGGN